MAQVTIDRAAGSASEQLRDFIALLKPRVMSLVVFTGLAGLLVAPGDIHPFLAAVAVLCIAVAAGGAGAINMWYDRDIDAIMARTRKRPLVQGRVDPSEALAFGVVLTIFSVMLMGIALNWLAAGLLALATLFYVFVYTVWLKRRTPQNIVIGGAAGSFPPMIGWVAATGSISLDAILLFALIFFWTPPHFWALAIKYKDDYASVDVPMLPSVAGIAKTSTQIFLYTVAVWALSIAFWWAADLGVVYLVSAVVLGAAFTWLTVVLHRDPTTRNAMKVFTFSITYVTLLFGAMAIDQLVSNG